MKTGSWHHKALNSTRVRAAFSSCKIVTDKVMVTNLTGQSDAISGLVCSALHRLGGRRHRLDALRHSTRSIPGLVAHGVLCSRCILLRFKCASESANLASRIPPQDVLDKEGLSVKIDLFEVTWLHGVAGINKS